MTAGAIGLGLLIGLSLGALGGGGSILTVPALVYLLGLTAQEATTASLVIVGVTAAAGSVGHARSGHTRWGAGVLLAAVGVPASLLGTSLNRRVDPDVLLLSFAALMLVAAAGMLVRSRSARSTQAPAAGPVDAPPGSAPVGDAPPAARQPSPARTTRGRFARGLRLAVAGLGVGFLTGFLGVGGGFVVVPVLVVLLSTPMPVAIGTSLLVISLNSGVALAARAGSGGFAWDVIVPFTIAAVAGSLAGKRVADRVSPTKLTVAFAVLLVAVAVYVAVQAALGLT